MLLLAVLMVQCEGMCHPITYRNWHRRGARSKALFMLTGTGGQRHAAVSLPPGHSPVPTVVGLGVPRSWSGRPTDRRVWRVSRRINITPVRPVQRLT
jgi:hypothetical protein